MSGENILIIDVDEDSSNHLSLLMERLHYRFTILEDPQEALTQLKKEPFTIAIAEISLLQAEQIGSIHDQNPELCFIFTGHSLENVRDHIKPGVSDFLFKPFHVDDAEFRVRRIIFERDRRSQNEEAQKELQATREELERKNRELESSLEDLEHVKHLYKEIGNELNTTSEELRRANNKLEIMAITDGLTEIYNHRYFMEQISEKFKDAKKQSIPLSLLMIDIDHFKAFNDNHGHMTGDLVLKEIARILKSSCRKEDIVARYGGEEFAIILPKTNSHEAETMAEKIRAVVENHHLQDGKEARKVTVSVGVGTKGDDAESLDDLISSADKALYSAKFQGRNRVVFGDKNPPVSSEAWFSRF